MFPQLLISSPDTIPSIITSTGLCEDNNLVTIMDTGITYQVQNCATTPTFTQVFPIPQSDWNQTNAASSDYIKNKPTIGSRTYAYPSRALNSCFQISSSKDADFHYKVDVATGLSLTSGAQGTVTITSYTNSGCTTGAQALADGTSAQTGTLIVGLGINQTASVSLDGTVPAGKWAKITTANTVGTPTFTIRTVQAESY